MKNFQEDTTQNKIREILSQIKLNQEKYSKRLCSHNSIIGITFQVKSYKKTRASKRQQHPSNLQNQLKSHLYGSIECNRKKSSSGLEISKAVLHGFQEKGFTERSLLTKNKQNNFTSSTARDNVLRLRRKLRTMTRDHEEKRGNKPKKEDYVRRVSSNTQIYFEPKVCAFKPNSMHMRFRTDYQLLKPDIEGWKTQFDQTDLNTQF